MKNARPVHTTDSETPQALGEESALAQITVDGVRWFIEHEFGPKRQRACGYSRPALATPPSTDGAWAHRCLPLAACSGLQRTADPSGLQSSYSQGLVAYRQN